MAKDTYSAIVLGGCIQGEIWREITYIHSQNLNIVF